MLWPLYQASGWPFTAGPAIVSDFVVEPLSARDQPTVFPLTFPAFRPLLATALATEAGVIALVAKADDLPIALLLAKPAGAPPRLAPPPSQVALELLSIATVAGYRCQGAACRLLHALTEVARARGYTGLTTEYTTKLGGLKAWEALLAAAGWQAPRPTMRLALSRRETLAAAPWVRNPRWDPAGCEVFPWNELGIAERRQLEQMLAAGVIPAGLSPFADEPFLVPDLSIGLRLRGQVVAWITMTRAPLVADAVCCRSLFVLPHLRQGRGFGPFLIGESLRRYADSAVRAERPTAIYGIPLGTQKQINFFRKRLEAYCFETYESRTAIRRLAVP
jgi:GNAT superfamily N-acetyltransferase